MTFEKVQAIGTALILFSLFWGFGVMLHMGFEHNPRQPRLSIPKGLALLLTLGSIKGNPVAVPTLFQLCFLICCIIGTIETLWTNRFPPIWTPKIMFGCIVVCGLLAQVFNR